ncbi:MAG: NAD(P)H-dependent oxidoreductase [Candidatus Bathyarchaeia archaeon]|jgi:flavodoxin
MRTLVIYYSNRGTTARIAKAIIKATNATERELIDSNSRTGKGMMSLALSAMLSWSSKLKNPNYALDGFDAIVLLSPIWAGNPTPAMNSFLKKVNLNGKRVLLGLVGAGDENLKAAEKLTKMVEAKGGSNTEVVYLKGSSLANGAEPLSESQVDAEAAKIISKL